MSKKLIEDDRQTRYTQLSLNINVTEKYNVKEPITCIREATNIITNTIIDSFNDIKDIYDIESIKQIKIDLHKTHSIYVGLDFTLNTWETKTQMYNRRSSEKRERELKEQKLAQDARLLGFKLEKIDE